MKVHFKIHIEEKQSRPHICEVCSITFTTKGSLEKHSKFHGGEKPYACKVFSATFAQ